MSQILTRHATPTMGALKQKRGRAPAMSEDMSMRKFTRAAAAGAGAVLLASGAALAAWAAGPGVGDVSDSMRYDGTLAPIGAPIPELSGADDDEHTVAAPFPINFFGVPSAGLCVTTNGGFFPVPTTGDSCSSAYDKDLENLALDATAPIIAPLAGDLDLGNCADNSDDGFGTACEIYYGTTTVDGRDAFALTWYRVPMYSGDNDPALDNTFQVVIIKRATGDDTVGWDFDIEFNYGTLTDAEDGYSGAAPSSQCDSGTAIADCRWGVGWADYDPADGGTADPYELFGSTPITELVDGGSSALTVNSLNSSEPGRYVFSMVAGVTTGFSVPTLTPTGTPPSAPAEAELADTGADWALVALAAGLILVGVAALVASRAMREASTRRA